MNTLEITGFCWNDGLPCKELFCNDKCKKAFKLKEQRQNKVKSGKRANYGPTGI